MKCIIDGAYGFNNVGDEAMLNVSSKVLSDIVPDIEIIVSSYLPERISELHGLKSTNEFLLGTLLKNIKKLKVKNLYKQFKLFCSVDYIVFSGGSILNDSKGLTNLFVILYKIIISSLFNYKVIFWGVSIGPIRSGRGKLMLKWILKKSQLVIVRDENSYLLAKQFLSNSNNIKLGVDILFSGNSVGLESKTVVNDSEDNTVRIGLSLRPYPPIIGVDTNKIDDLLINQMSELCLKIYPNKKVIFVPLIFSDGDNHKDDLRMLLNLRNKTKDSIFEFSEYKISDIKNENYFEFLCDFFSIYKSLDLVIGERFHSLVLAQLLDVPYVCLSYDRKINELAKQAGVENCVVDLVPALNSATLVERVLSIVDYLGNTKPINKKGSFEIMEYSESNRELLKNTLV